MPRIRSIHPDQWNDEDFVELTVEARLLAIAIRNFADDKGIFEWKPKTIKMRVFPADNFDCEELLAQLIAQNQVVRFMCDGKPYGAIRNFTKYQKPKKPNDIYPINQDIKRYVGMAERQSAPPEMCDEFGTSSEIAQQMEREEESIDTCAIEEIAHFDEFWDCFPHRGGVKRNRKRALEKFEAALSAGVSGRVIIDKAKAYGVLCKKIQKHPRDPARWLNEEGWMDEATKPAAVSEIDIRRRNADAILAGKAWMCQHISAAAARECVEQGLVTADDCRKVGVL